ncbi:MAG: AbrB/MazE/SpoVT family DNA-binding domain-containing protein [Saccharofermentanales bacterium]
MITELRKKAQITIPKSIIDVLGLKEGDKLDVVENNGMIQLVPVVVYPKKYVDELVYEINEIKEQIKYGTKPTFDNVEDLIKQLEK